MIQHVYAYMYDNLILYRPYIIWYIIIIIFLAETLLLRTPQSHQKGFHEALYKTMQIKDVLSYRDQKLWKFSSSVICASIVVQLAPSGNEQAIINQITQYFKGNKG